MSLFFPFRANLRTGIVFQAVKGLECTLCMDIFRSCIYTLNRYLSCFSTGHNGSSKRVTKSYFPLNVVYFFLLCTSVLVKTLVNNCNTQIQKFCLGCGCILIDVLLFNIYQSSDTSLVVQTIVLRLLWDLHSLKTT